MKKNKNKKIIYFLALSVTLPFLSLATGGIEDPTSGAMGTDISSVIKNMINGLLKLALPLLVLAYIYVGFLFVKAQGSSEELQKARKAFMWLIVGTVLVIGANAIYSVVKDTINQVNI